jgi:hypothetical protein
MLVGATLLAVAGAVVCFPATWRRWPVLATFLVFLLLSVGMAAVGRSGWGSNYMLQDRYRLYGLLIVAIILIIVTDAVGQDTRMRVATVFAAAIFCLLSYAAALPSLLTAARRCAASALNAQLGNAAPMISADGWPSAIKTLERAKQLGLYDYPSPLSADETRSLRQAAAPTSLPLVQVKTRLDGGLGALLEPAVTPPSATRPDFAVMKVAGRPFVLARETTRARFLDMPGLRSIFSRQVSFIVPDPLYVSGDHPLVAYSRGPNGRVEMMWSGLAQCPPRAGFLLPQ